MATNFLRTIPTSHAKKVCSLYKRACREIEANIFQRHNRILEIRYQQVLLRDRFDKNKDLVPELAKEALEAGERELKLNLHTFPKQFTNSPGGINHGRHPPDPDWILDTWHPLEKAQYPEYFARRDVRKREFLERQEKKMQEYEADYKQIKGDTL